MPGYDLWFLAWFAFVPVLLAVRGKSPGQRTLLLQITGLIWSIGSHNWYPDVLGTGTGLFLMAASGLLYAFFLQVGCTLQEAWPGRSRVLRLLIAPAVWTALEWLRFVLPVTGEWWIEVLAKTQWTEPALLQILSVTGFPGLSFLIMLANAALASLSATVLTERRWDLPAAALLIAPLLVWGWGHAVLAGADRTQTVTVAAVSELANQDAGIAELGGRTAAGDGYLADTPAMSQAIFEVNVALTLAAAAEAAPDFIVWGENEFADYGDERMMSQLKRLAASARAYIAADVVWRSDTGLHDTAVLIGPEGREAGKTAKIRITGGEESYGFTPGTERGRVFETPIGPVGLAVCWDRHPTHLIRALASGGAKLVLIPVDDDFNGNARFPYFGASDTVFRAAENRVPIVTGATSGLAQIVTPYGEVIDAVPVNERGFVTGDIFTSSSASLYAKWGDWFGGLTALAGVLIAGHAWRSADRRRDP